MYFTTGTYMPPLDGCTDEGLATTTQWPPTTTVRACKMTSAACAEVALPKAPGAREMVPKQVMTATA